MLVYSIGRLVCVAMGSALRSSKKNLLTNNDISVAAVCSGACVYTYLSVCGASVYRSKT